MSNINKKGIWTTPIFHELYGLNIAQCNLSPYNYAERSYTPNTGENSTFNAYYILYSDFELGEVMRIIMKVKYEGFDTSNTDGTFNFRFQGAKRNSNGDGIWTGAGVNELTDSLNSYQNLKNLVLSQSSGSFIYNTTFTISENFYNTYAGCNISTRSDYSNGTANFTMYKPIIFPDKYYINTDSVVRQADNFLSCKEIIEY